MILTRALAAPPDIRDLRAVSVGVAASVIRTARQMKSGRPIPDEAIEPLIRGFMWEPAYPS